ncbi:MAG: cyclopropane-fatty-acyl-phospholipid synthase family protein [Lachnospiraceae bacterium]|nr:cyclopropane-fatty-acyl-phospholipid synthase family protein [Lachnospiraceae bacterium]
MHLKEKEFLEFMRKFDDDPFTICIHGKDYPIGVGKPIFRVQIHKIPSISELMTSTSIALGEAYMRGEIEIEGDLYHALNHFMGQLGKFQTDKKRLKKLMFSSNSKKNQKKEVSSHYDIGNSFYKLWLDDTMSYSCGYFEKESDTLGQAQHQKADRILQKLALEPDMTICDIGCGWGFLLLEAAKKYHIHGLGITLSSEQKMEFERQIVAYHLEDYLEVELLDYRDLPKLNRTFDRVVSVGMIEHVGRENYALFMNTVKEILNPGGLFLLHFISGLQEYPGDAWMKKYIFPGGMVPSLREMIQIAGNLKFYTLDVESLRRHYNHTLLCWNQNFQAHRSEIVQMFDEEFAKMWELYLCSCAASFENGVIDLHQILISNGVNNQLPMTRWY